MIPRLALMALVASANGGHDLTAGALPVCSNRVINGVVKRVGCTLGDTKCWIRSGGFCMDYIAKKLGARRTARTARLEGVKPEEVARGDVAMFSARAHYAYVERVVRDEHGAAVAVDLSEYNFGTCWVDEGAMVTEKYGLVNRRASVPLRDVDGGFLRPRPR